MTARKIEETPETIKSQVRKPSMTWAFECGAGDGNRTRAVSSGSAWITPRRAADLGVRPVVSDRGRPLVILSDGPTISPRPGAARAARTPPAHPSPPDLPGPAWINKPKTNEPKDTIKRTTQNQPSSTP
ncbi:hypothetical protein GCM10010517_49760 [Streptosporangium fragile]|uniref:Uncharacterized protein n=1 Tax=Streptosporangium fragile TaxID=46186 RepID=A0ABN3W2L1_9ACTN